MAQSYLSDDGRGLQPLLTSLCFEYIHRPTNDRSWGLLYSTLLGASILAATYAFVNRNPAFDLVVAGDYLKDPAHCPASDPTLGSLIGDTAGGTAGWAARALGAAVTAEDWRPTYFLEAAGVLFAGSAAAALLLSVAFMLTLQAHPLVFVYFAIAIQVVAPLLVSAAAYASGNEALGLACLLATIALSLSFYFSKDSIELVARLLGVSARALRANPTIFVLSVGLNVLLLALLAGLSLGSAASLANGDVAFNPERISKDHCVDEYERAVPCCLWAPDPWMVTGTTTVSLLAALWSIRLAFQVKVFTISGCIAQWYFAPAGTSGPPGSGLRSLGHATGPSFGSLCLAGLVMSAAQLLRGLFLRCFRQRRGAMHVLPSVGCSTLCAALEQLSKLSVVHMAMTGSDLWSSGRDTLDLLRRNAMDAYSAWWLPPVVLQLASTVLSLAWGYCVYLCALWYWAADEAAGSPTQRVAWQSTVVLAAMSGLLTFLALQYFCGIILNVLDAVFVCYAIDRDHGTCSRIDVHEVYVKLPGSHPCHDGGYPDDASLPFPDYYHPHHSLDPASSLPQQTFSDPAFASPFQAAPSWQHQHSHNGKPNALLHHQQVNHQHASHLAKFNGQSHPPYTGRGASQSSSRPPAYPPPYRPPYPYSATRPVLQQAPEAQAVPQYLPIATSYGHLSSYGQPLYGGPDDGAPSAPKG